MKIILLAVCLLAVVGLNAAENRYSEYRRYNNPEGADQIGLSDDETTIMLYKKNDAKVYFYRFYDMKQTQVQEWNPIPIYLETFTNSKGQNAVIFAGDNGQVFVAAYSVMGFSVQQKLNAFQDCELVKVSPSSDKRFFAALCKDSKQIIIGSIIVQQFDLETIETDFIIKTFQWHPTGSQLAIAGTKEDGKTQVLIIYDNDKKENKTDLSEYLEGKVQDLEFSQDGKIIAIIYQGAQDPEPVTLLNLDSPKDPHFLIATGAVQLFQLKRRGNLLTTYDAERVFVWQFDEINYGSYLSALQGIGLSATGGSLVTIDPKTNDFVFSRFCGQNEVYMNADMKCAACTNPCNSCFVSQTKCSGCIDNFYLDEGKYECKRCSTNCKTCTADGCKVCQDGFFLDDAVCSPCSTPFVGCLTCTAEKCDKCAQNWVLNTNNQCQCAERFVQVEKECLACPDHCQVCASIDTCTTCDVQEHRRPTPVEGKCICDVGFFQNPLEDICSPCVLGCNLCDNAVTCEACDTKSNWSLNKDKICVCQKGFLQTGAQCKFCGDLMTGCILCAKQKECSQCADGYDLDTNTHLCSLHPEDGGVSLVVVIVVGLCVLIGLGVGSYFLMKILRKRRQRKVQTLLESQAHDQNELD